MSEHFRIRSIPPRTMHDIWRAKAKTSTPPGGTSLRKRTLNTGEDYDFDLDRHVFQRQTEKRPKVALVLPEKERITCQIEQAEDYNSQGNLALILQYSGVELIQSPFTKIDLNYGPDTTVFSLPVNYGATNAFLILSTFGDIFESQVAVRIDVNPFFREEIYLPELMKTYSPKSMNPTYKNGLVIVTYSRLNASETDNLQG